MLANDAKGDSQLRKKGDRCTEDGRKTIKRYTKIEPYYDRIVYIRARYLRHGKIAELDAPGNCKGV